MGLKNTKFDGTYASIGADGSIRIPAQANEPGAVLREYELSDGTTGSKWEKIYTEISGKITGINFYDGDYGKVLNVILEDNDGKYSLSVSTQSNFAEDLMKKLPNIDLSSEVVIKPYSFDDKKTGKNRKGCSVIQGENKITNFFIKDLEDGKYEVANGYPPVPNQTMDKEDWKIYFLHARKFLVSFIEQQIIPMVTPIDKVDAEVASMEADEEVPMAEEPSEEEISVKDIPFK